MLSSSLMAENAAPQQLAAANTPISLASHTLLKGDAIARTSRPSEIDILTPGLYEIYYRGVSNASQAVTLSQSTATLIRSTEVGSFVVRSESPGVTWSNVVVMAAKLTDGI